MKLMDMARWPTMADDLLYVLPASKTGISVMLAFVGSMILAASAHIQIAFWPVPMTMQTFAVLVIGMAYGKKLGVATVLLYLFEGAMGLPVFANGGGILYFTGSTTGYLTGFVLAVYVVGWLAERGWDRSFVRTLLANCIGTVIIMVTGYFWLSGFMIFTGAASIYSDALFMAWVGGVEPFLAGAVAKVLLAALTLPLLWKIVAIVRGTNNT